MQLEIHVYKVESLYASSRLYNIFRSIKQKTLKKHQLLRTEKCNRFFKYFSLNDDAFCQGGGLFPQISAHVGDAFFLLVPPCAFHLKLLLILAEAVNLLGYVLKVGSGTGPFQKLLLQFGQPFVNVGKRLAFFRFQNSFDVLLQTAHLN